MKKAILLIIFTVSLFSKDINYIKSINFIKDNQKVNLYYTSHQKIIDDFMNIRYVSDNKFCTEFIHNITINESTKWIKPTIEATSFKNINLQNYLGVFPSWVESTLKERLYLSEENKYDERVREGSTRDDYLYESNFIKLYDVDLDSNQSTPNNIFILVDAFYGGKDFGLFGEKRYKSAAYEENDDPLSIYAVLEREKLVINKFDYVSGTVSRYKEKSTIRELIKYKNNYYIFTALYNKEKKQYDRIYLKYFQKLDETSFKNVQYRRKCVIKIE